MFLEILNISSMHTAHNEAMMPINATRLLPSKRLSKSSKVTLNIISAIASVISV
jgi:hypothetical protein